MKVVRKLEFKTVDGNVYQFSSEEWSWVVDPSLITVKKGKVKCSEVPCPEVEMWFPLHSVVWLKVAEDTVD